MREKPKVAKSVFGAIVLLVFVYFTVHTLASNQEIVTSKEIEVPIVADSPLGVDVEPKQEFALVEIKGTDDMYKELANKYPSVKVSLVEKELEEGVEEGVEGVEDVVSKDTEDDINLEDMYEQVVDIEGLDGFIYSLVEDVGVNLTEIEGEYVNLKVKVKGKRAANVKDVKIKEKVVGYFKEDEKELIEEIGVYIDVDSADKEGKVIGSIKILSIDGEELAVENYLDKEKVEVEVLF